MTRSLSEYNQSGQAMVEFIVTATFILVPLFLMIPLLAKYIEIQQFSVQAARYEAWEYTAWFRAGNDVPTSFNKDNSITGLIEPLKSTTAVQNESRARFFSNSNQAISNLDSTGWDATQSNPFLKDYQGNLILDDLKKLDGNLNYNQQTPDLTTKLTGGIGVVTTLIDVIEAVPDFLGSTLSVGTFDPSFGVLNSGGYQQSTVTIPINNAPNYTNMKTSAPLFEKPLNLSFGASAAVLSEGWNAGGREHAKMEAEGLVPTILLRKPFNFVTDILSYIPFIPSSELSSIEWGHTDSEAIPPEYLDSDEETLCDDGGYCSY